MWIDWKTRDQEGAAAAMIRACGSQSVVPEPAAAALELTRNGNPQAHPRPVESETLGVGAAMCEPIGPPGDCNAR